MKNESVATIVKEVNNLGGLSNKLKLQMVTKLGYPEKIATEQADRYSKMFQNAISE